MYDEKRRNTEVLRGESTDNQLRTQRLLEEIRADVLWIRKKMQEAKE